MAGSDKAGARRRADGRASSRAPVDSLLPAEVVTSLRGIARSGKPITPGLIRQVDREYEINEKYGLSRRRLRTFLTKESAPTEVEDTGDQCVTPEDSWPDKVRSHRQRQASTASILDALFGPLADCDPKLWEQRAYLVLLGTVYERLAAADELSPKEIADLGKVLAEHRRVDERTRAADAKQDAAPTSHPPDGKLPEHFADVVRQVYGTNFHQPDSSRVS